MNTPTHSRAQRRVSIALVVAAALAAAPLAGAGPAASATSHHAGASTKAHHPAPAGAPSPQQALKLLREGNQRFATGANASPHTSTSRVRETAAGQHPFAAILSCADSRVPVERVFDRGVGDLFVVRIAGNSAGSDQVGTLEYGLDHLGTPLIVVMGHTACGAVKAAASGAEVHGAVAGLIDDIAPAAAFVKANRPELTGDALIDAIAEANVWQSIDTLLTTSATARQHVSSGNVMLIGAVYDIRTGIVRWLGPHPRQARIIERAPTKALSHTTPVLGAPAPAPAPAPAAPAPLAAPASAQLHADEEHDQPPAAPAAGALSSDAHKPASKPALPTRRADAAPSSTKKDAKPTTSKNDDHAPAKKDDHSSSSKGGAHH